MKCPHLLGLNYFRFCNIANTLNLLPFILNGDESEKGTATDAEMEGEWRRERAKEQTKIVHSYTLELVVSIIERTYVVFGFARASTDSQ